MASLLETRKKIRSVKQTAKITKAMQLVSASKMKVFQKKAVSLRHYAWDLLSFMKDYLKSKDQSIFAQQRKTGKTLFILYSSDKGLCGPLNTKLQKALFGSNEWQQRKPQERLLMTIGKKAADYAQYNEIPVEKAFKGVKEQLSLLDSLELLKPMLDFWTTKKVKKIFMVAPHYKSALVFYPLVKPFLPLTPKMLEEHLKAEGRREPLVKFKKDEKIISEPSKKKIREVMVEQIIQLLFVQAFFELKASEYSSRMIAMQNATDNALEIIDDLTLLYNKGRQAKITQELAEISGAISAL